MRDESDYNPAVLIGERLREIREAKGLSQGDIERRTGMLRMYVSRWRTVTQSRRSNHSRNLRMLCRSLYSSFSTRGRKPCSASEFQMRSEGRGSLRCTRPRTRRWKLFHRHLARMKESDRLVLLAIAQRMAGALGRPRRSAKRVRR